MNNKLSQSFSLYFELSEYYAPTSVVLYTFILGKLVELFDSLAIKTPSTMVTNNVALARIAYNDIQIKDIILTYAATTQPCTLAVVNSLPPVKSNAWLSKFDWMQQNRNVPNLMHSKQSPKPQHHKAGALKLHG